MEANQQLHAYALLKENTKILSFEPHLHAPGARMCLEAIWGYNIQTLNCVGYDHNWVRGYDYDDDAAPLLPKDTILHIIGYMDNSPSNKNVPDPRNWQGSGNRSVANMFIDLGNRVSLTDEQFQAEMAARREKLKLTRNSVVIGCPLCSVTILPPARRAAAAAGSRASERTRTLATGQPGVLAGLGRPAPWSCWRRAPFARSRSSYSSGQNVSPAYEGWEEDADGTKYFVFGYMNRNWEEELDVPVGPDNGFNIGGADQGQPTHFLPRRNRFVFRVPVPPGFSRQGRVGLDADHARARPRRPTRRSGSTIRSTTSCGRRRPARWAPERAARRSAPTSRRSSKVQGRKSLTAKVGEPVDDRRGRHRRRHSQAPRLGLVGSGGQPTRGHARTADAAQNHPASTARCCRRPASPSARTSACTCRGSSIAARAR